MSNTDEQQRIEALERHMAEQDRELEEVVAVLHAIVQSGAQSVLDGPPAQILDTLLTCNRCNRRLALYNPDKDEVRVKSKDQYLYFKSGPGGYIKIICRGCGHENLMPYDEEPKESDG